MKIMTPQHGCAWITGASSGIGAALAEELAGRGWTVAISARRERDLQNVAAQHEDIHCFPCDVRDRAAMAQTVSAIETKLGPIALGVMNAGIYLPTALPEFDATLFDRTFEVNLNGTVNGLAALVPLMVARGEGHISLVSSVAGYGGLVTSAAYGASKAAVNSLTQTLALELSPGIRVNAVAPGPIPTKNFNESTNFPADQPLEKLLRVPLGRVGEPDDIGHAVVFMAAPASSWITGQCLYVTGGL